MEKKRRKSGMGEIQISKSRFSKAALHDFEGGRKLSNVNHEDRWGASTSRGGRIVRKKKRAKELPKGGGGRLTRAQNAVPRRKKKGR